MKEQNPEEQILDAAKQVFIRKGFDGARMQEIADLAGINKAMLHYYFRSKDQLFYKIFDETFQKIMPQIRALLMNELSFEEKIHLFVGKYIDVLKANPYIPMFILHELSRNPEKLQNVIMGTIQPNFSAIKVQIESEMNKGTIKQIDIRQFLMNLIGLCIFPVAAQPLMQTLFQCDSDTYGELLEERKKIVPEIILKWLKP